MTAKRHRISTADPRSRTSEFFRERGWEVFDFQKEVWDAHARGGSGLIHAPTGTGKTYAAWFGPLMAEMGEADPSDGLHVLWITPLKALAADTQAQLLQPLDVLDIPWTVELRTGDTPGHVKTRQRHSLPQTLITDTCS